MSAELNLNPYYLCHYPQCGKPSIVQYGNGGMGEPGKCVCPAHIQEEVSGLYKRICELYDPHQEALEVIRFYGEKGSGWGDKFSFYPGVDGVYEKNCPLTAYPLGQKARDYLKKWGEG